MLKDNSFYFTCNKKRSRDLQMVFNHLSKFQFEINKTLHTYQQAVKFGLYTQYKPICHIIFAMYNPVLAFSILTKRFVAKGNHSKGYKKNQLLFIWSNVLLFLCRVFILIPFYSEIKKVFLFVTTYTVFGSLA